MKVIKRIRAILFVLSIVIMVVFYFVSQSAIMKTELKHFKTEIKADTQNNIITAKNLLYGMVKDLENTADEIEKYDNIWHPDIEKILKFSHKLNSFDSIFIADSEGNGYAENGEKFQVIDQDYYQKALAGNVVISDILPSKRFEAIQIIACPLISPTQGVKGVLFGLVNVETFSWLLSNSTDQDKYIYIVDSEGTTISCFNKYNRKSKHEIIIKNIKYWDFQDITIEQLRDDIHNRNEGGFSYSYEDVQWHGYHMPLGIHDWQIILTAKETEMDAHILSIRKIDLIDSIVDSGCLITILMCLYFHFRDTNKEIRQVNQKIKKNNTMMKMAVERSNHIVFEYDIEKATIELKTKNNGPLFRSQIISSVPECFIDKKIIVEDSVVALRELFKKIKEVKDCQADVQIVSNGQEKIWYRIYLHNIYNEQGNIIATVGSAEDISVTKKGEIAIKRKEELRKSLVANALLYAIVDLDTNRVIEVNGKEKEISYQDDLYRKIIDKVSDQHRFYVSQALSLQNIKKEYHQGKEFIEVQCIAKSKQADKWISCFVYRVHIDGSSRITLLICDIDKKKRKEIALKEQAEHDGLTGLYNAATTRAKINEILQSQHALDKSCIFIILDLDNFKKINDSFGHVYGDQVLIEVAKTLTQKYRSSDIIGRLGGDEFVVMLCNVKSKKLINNFMEELRLLLTKTYVYNGQSIVVSASMGVAIAPIDGITFEDLYKKADKALYDVKREGKNGYKIWDENVD